MCVRARAKNTLTINDTCRSPRIVFQDKEQVTSKVPHLFIVCSTKIVHKTCHTCWMRTRKPPSRSLGPKMAYHYLKKAINHDMRTNRCIVCANVMLHLHQQPRNYCSTPSKPQLLSMLLECICTIVLCFHRIPKKTLCRVFLFPRVNKTQFMKFQEHNGTQYHSSSLILVRNTNVHAPRNLCSSKRPPIKFWLRSKRKAAHSCVWVIMCKGGGCSCGSSMGYCHALGQH